MLYLNSVASCLVLLFSGYLLKGPINGHLYQHEVVHEVTVFHPGMKQAKACKLVERKIAAGFTIDFYMEVESVICLNGLCKVVDVRIVWDKLGNYLNFELAKGVALEKKDGTPFSPVDYDKLHQILSDKQSIFNAYELGQIVDINQEGAGIDGISGATILTDEMTTVKGATWTCYTLWHWANGEVNEVIFDITGRSVTNHELFDFLPRDSLSVRLALEQFAKRKMYDTFTVNAVAEIMPAWEMETVKQGIDYLRNGPPEIFHMITRRMFPKVESPLRFLLLKAVLNDHKQPAGPVLHELKNYIPLLNSFQEVNVVLNRLEEMQARDSKLNEMLLALLTVEDFVAARRVYWFLKTQDLPFWGERKLVEFGDKYAGRL